VTARGQVKILDFGLAKVAAAFTEVLPDSPAGTDSYSSSPVSAQPDSSMDFSLSRTGVAMGTAGYMSPEQVRGEKLDARTDLFSFGLILFEMAVGQRAFSGDTAAIVQEAILHQSLPPLRALNPELPVRLEEIVSKSLEKDRKLRYASAAEMLADLRAVRAVVDGLPDQVDTPPTQEVKHRNKSWVWVAAALGAVLSVAAVGYFLETRQNTLPFEHFSIQKATESDHVEFTAISPDGTYIATISQNTNGAESLWARHIPSGTGKLLLQDAAFKYRDLYIAPDGENIYFYSQDLGTQQYRTDLYRIPITGGRPQLVLMDLVQSLSFIDGGRRLCFYRQDSFRGNYEFLSAGMDGRNEQVLASGKKPFPVTIACAPDGRFAAVADEQGKVETLEFASGARNTLISMVPIGGRLQYLRWEPNGQGLFGVSVLSRDDTHLVFLSYPGGKLRQITNDLSNYTGISITDDGRTITSTQTNRYATFATLSLEEPSHLEEHGPRDLNFFSWLDDENIVASDFRGILRAVNLRTDLTTTLNVERKMRFQSPDPCGQDTLVALGYLSDQREEKIYKMRLDGSVAKPITGGPNDYVPQCTPDGKWLVYEQGSEFVAPYLIRLSLEGGPERRIAASRGFDLSSDGRMIANLTPTKESQLQIFSTEPLEKIQTLPLARDVGLVTVSADHLSVFYATTNDTETTIWQQPFNSVTPVKAAGLPGERVLWMKVSPDGKKLGLTLMPLSPQSEAVLIRDVH